MKQLLVVILFLLGHQVLGNPWKELGNTWREQQHSIINSEPEKNIRADRCTNNGGTTFNYDGLSYCARRTCTSWNETNAWCEGIGMAMARPKEPNALATYIHSLSLRCWYWLDGKGNGSNQIWLNGTSISNTDPLWDSSPNVQEDYCLALTICNNLSKTLLTNPCTSGCGYRLCQGVTELTSSPVSSETTLSTVTSETTSSTRDFDTTTPITTTETTTLTGCGGEYNSTRGVIRHPLSGGDYQNNENCIWIIRATDPFNIIFDRFNTEQRYDYLRVRVGEGNESHIIGAFNGNSVPSPVQIDTNIAYLIFTSDNSVTRTGFTLRWEPAGPPENSSSTVSPMTTSSAVTFETTSSTVPSETTSSTVSPMTSLSAVTFDTTSSTVPTVTTSPFLEYYTSTPVTTTENITLTGCGSEFNSTRGVIRHPLSGGGEYQNNENCTWIIRATDPFNIIFISFDIELNWDYLRIKVGEGNDSDIIENFTGNRVPSSVQINTNTAYLIFTSDRSVTRTGFELRWEPAGTTEITSSPVPSDTTSTITVPTLTTILCLDYGTTTPVTYGTTTPVTTTENITLTGCGGEYNSTSGVIRHPLSGGSYQNNENCHWIIRTTDPFDIIFVNFNTEQRWDYLRIRDGEGSTSNIIQNFTGNSVPSPVHISTSTAYLIFTSDSSVTRSGFVLRWEPSGSTDITSPRVSTETTPTTVPIETTSSSVPIETTSPSVPIEFTTQTSPTDTNDLTSCGGEYNSSSGIIRHPLAVGYYQKNENCSWIIRTEDPFIIRFVSFDTEQSYDYLQIRDGNSMESHIIGQFSGNSLPKPVQTTSNTAHLFFVSDNSVTRTGFLIYWETAEPSETTPTIVPSEAASTTIPIEATTAK